MRVLNLEKVNQKEGERQKPQCLLEPRLQGDILSLLPCTVGYTNQADGKWEGTTQRRKNPGAGVIGNHLGGYLRQAEPRHLPCAL